MHFRARWALARYEASKLRERAQIKLAWALPGWLVTWAAIRLGAHATTGSFGSTVVPDLTFMDALQRWDDPTGGDRRRGRR